MVVLAPARYSMTKGLPIVGAAFSVKAREIISPGPPGGNAAEQREAFFQRFPELRGKQILLFLGRIHPKKGINLFLEAFSNVLKSGGIDQNRLHLEAFAARQSILGDNNFSGGVAELKNRLTLSRDSRTFFDFAVRAGASRGRAGQ